MGIWRYLGMMGGFDKVNKFENEEKNIQGVFWLVQPKQSVWGWRNPKSFWRNPYQKVRVKTLHLAVELLHFHFFGRDFAILKHFLGATSQKKHPVFYDPQASLNQVCKLKYLSFRWSIFSYPEELKGAFLAIRKSSKCDFFTDSLTQCQFFLKLVIIILNKFCWKGIASARS